MKEVYETNIDNKERYALGRFESKPMIILGINPSRATREMNDTTISIVEKIGMESDFAKENGMNGFLMLNIYPFRATSLDEKYPEEPNAETVKRNLQTLDKYVTKGTKVVAAWGGHITDKMYFVDMLKMINRLVKLKGAEWVSLCTTKYGHPHHPTRLKYSDMTFDSFDMEKYLSNLIVSRAYARYSGAHPMVLLPDWSISYLKPSILLIRYGEVVFLSGKSGHDNTLTAIWKADKISEIDESVEYIAIDDNDDYIKRLIELNEANCSYVTFSSNEAVANIIKRIEHSTKINMGNARRIFFVDGLEKICVSEDEISRIKAATLESRVAVVMLTSKKTKEA